MSRGLPVNLADVAMPIVEQVEEQVVTKTRRKISAYERRYKAAFKRVSTRYKNKAGKWLKDGFKKAVKAAHKEARK